eukprot:scaffold361754_cov35-Prasinocladus_malaysianus.AAC.2
MQTWQYMVADLQPGRPKLGIQDPQHISENTGNIGEALPLGPFSAVPALWRFPLLELRSFRGLPLPEPPSPGTRGSLRESEGATK